MKYPKREQYIELGDSEAGVRRTLKIMSNVARAGVDTPGLDTFACAIVPWMLDHALRQFWLYVPDPVTAEQVRTIPVMVAQFRLHAQFAGDCDDAATLAASMLLVIQHWTNRFFEPPRRVAAIQIVAVRPPDSVSFSHVFTEYMTSGLTFVRVDPTAPKDTDYTNWERMIQEV